MAEKHGKAWIHIDADAAYLEGAVDLIRLWISENGIEALNFAGATESEDAEIYPAVRTVLDALV